MNAQRILVCDSGSTKADWLYANGDSEEAVRTDGINPVRDSGESINRIVASLPDWKPECIYFYGAGCIEPYSASVRKALQERFPKALVSVESDLLGAARALFGHEEGIACILGTGSNSCLYKNGQITANVPPMGYILGDEGSGAVLGRQLVSDIVKGQLSQELRDAFMEEFQLTPALIVENVYRKPAANRFLASLCPFLSKHRDYDEIQRLLANEFERFLRRNVLLYNRPDLEIRYVGSISVHFEHELRNVHAKMGLKMGDVLASPVKKMMFFHHKSA
ncbi:MAG: ATPase [Bacteroidaceae bacterium]|nr:ATPase [Bacteroidaceae bacterium]